MFYYTHVSISIWLERPTKHQPRQQGLGSQGQHDVHLFSVAVVFPFSNPHVLQHHVDGKRIEKQKVAP